MKTRPIHLALRVTYCTLALCARELSAQETITPQQSSNANEDDAVTREQFNQFHDTEVNEHDGRRSEQYGHENTETFEYIASTREQSSYFEAAEANEYDDRTLLDTFGQVAKEFLTKRVIPDTDAECKWEWRYVRCEPYCECDFKFKGGDYHLGRSCRKRLHVEGNCDPTAPNAPQTGLRYAILRTVQTSRALMERLILKGKTSYRRLQDRVCSRLPKDLTCPKSDEDMRNVPLLAWQEKFLCKNQIPECLLKITAQKPFEPAPKARSDE